MTAASLSAFQARAGAAIVRKLSNAVADFGGGVVVEGLMRRDSIPALGASTAGMLSRDITLTVVQADLQFVQPQRGTPLMIDSIDYRVIYAEKNLEHGIVEMSLEKVQ